MQEFHIGERIISDDQPPFIMAEVGINHEGEFDKAIELVDAAAAAGVDCVKFQCHITEAEMIPTDMKPGEISDESLWDIIKRCELTEEEEYRVKEHCEEKGIQYLCTPFSREASDRLEQMDVAGFKIGSGECNNIPLLEHIARKKRPMILSTGMNDIQAIRASVEAIREVGCPLMLMHCTSEYPTPYEHVRLSAIQELKDEFQLPVGLSDHTMGIYTVLAGIAVGASAIEKHFTISRSWPGPDCPISIEPDELEELVKGGRAVFQALGGAKNILSTEQPVIDFAYACVVTIKDVEAGEQLSLDNTWVKRPGTGPIKAKDLENVLGKVAKRALSIHSQIAPEDLVDGSD